MGARGSGTIVQRRQRCPRCDTDGWRPLPRGGNSYVCVTCDRLGATRRKRARRKDPAFRVWAYAQQRAKDKLIPFRIRVADVAAVWPPDQKCPILRIALEAGIVFAQDHSPTLDRLDPARGYERGNIAVISMRANRGKNDLTADEHRRIADWMTRAGLR